LRIERPITLGSAGKSSLQYYKFIEGDPVRLGQVVSNLLNKAAKLMTHNGQISLTLEKVHNQAVFYARNNGIGIESSRLGRVFGIFDQLEHPTKWDNGGWTDCTAVRTSLDARSNRFGHVDQWVLGRVKKRAEARSVVESFTTFDL
jgi:light-regulated signal transduction histidine kinase (bacteriophytochrome)